MSRAAAVWVVAAFFATGCGTPVGVSRIDPQAAYRLQTESALSEGQPSEASKMVLRRLGLMDRFEKEPAAVLAELHKGLAASGDEHRLFALADLSFLYGEWSGDRPTFWPQPRAYAPSLSRRRPPASAPIGSSPASPTTSTKTGAGQASRRTKAAHSARGGTARQTCRVRLERVAPLPFETST
jgi:hypothetical protein